MVQKIGKSQQDKFTLALLARSEGVEAAEVFAASTGIAFDRELAVEHIRALLGNEEAEIATLLWLDEGFDSQYGKFAIFRDQQLQSHTTSMPERPLVQKLKALTVLVMRTAEQLFETSNTTQWQASAARQLRQADSFHLSSADATAPTIEPSFELEDHTLIISLSLPPGQYTMPASKEDVLLIMDGEQVLEFDFSRSRTGLFVHLLVKVGDAYVAQAKDKGCTLRYDADLQKVAVIVGRDPVVGTFGQSDDVA
jgi:hypothetical protein